VKRRSLLAAGAGLGGLFFGCSSPRSTLPRLDEPDAEVAALARSLTDRAQTPRERARTLYRFVREQVRFGFTPRFDDAHPGETLRFARGHCNPKGTLFATLLHAVDIGARQRFVTIDSEVLRGLFPPGASPPGKLTHSLVEVRLDGAWIPLDGYIVDRRLFEAARRRLRRPLGYGIHRDGAIDWDGRTPCMVQLADESMVLADHGAFRDPRRFYRSRGYVQRQSRLAAFFYRAFAVDAVNTHIDALRDG